MKEKVNIPFNIPPYIGKEMFFVEDAIKSHKICGDGKYTVLCNQWLEKYLNVSKVLLTTSGSSALDMAALLCNIRPGDEVILPSYTFSSTANAFALRGARLVFVDIRPDTMNIDEKKIEQAITDKTRVICPVHYAGVACEMDKIMAIAKKYNLLVVEDAAQGITSTYKQRKLGTIGDFGCFSFHETKNLSMGEGGAIVINNPELIQIAEIYREKGTNRSAFFRGEVAKYNWVEFGDSFLPSDINAAYLWAQLQDIDIIQNNRLETWNMYWKAFESHSKDWGIGLPFIPQDCTHNAHMFYIKCHDINQRTKFINYMKEKKIHCVFHYVPLHSAPAGLKYGRFAGEDMYTTIESEKLVRLPLYYNMEKDEVDYIIRSVFDFFMKESNLS